MKKQTKVMIIGIVFTTLVGALLHFTYAFSGNNAFVALFSAVNESTWEHLKLLFFPYCIYMIYENYSTKIESNNFWTAKFIGLLCGLIFIPVVFYLYTHILGTNYLILDILTFTFGVIVAYIVSFWISKKDAPQWNRVCILGFILFLLFFFLLTFCPFHIELFRDPVTNTYGVSLR